MSALLETSDKTSNVVQLTKSMSLAMRRYQQKSVGAMLYLAI